MAVPVIADLTAKFQIDSSIATTRLQWCLDTALRKVKKLIGQTAYDEIFDGDTSTLTDSWQDTDATNVNETADRIADVTDATFYFAMANVLENANMRIRASGQVVRETDAGSPALGGGSQITNQYLSPKEVAEWRGQMLSQADALISPYIIQQETNFYSQVHLVRG